MSDHLWFPELRSALSSSSHLFLHYCAFHRVDEHGEAILEEVGEMGYQPEPIHLARGRPFSVDRDTDLAVLLEMESLRTTPRALQQLRAVVNSWADASGGKVLIVSRTPRSSYPIGDGSSLILDSRDLHLHESKFAEWTVEHVQEQTDFRLPAGLSHSRGLASALSSLPEPFSRDELQQIASRVACQTLYELGSTYIAWLEEMVFEFKMTTVPVIDVPEWMQAELLGSGVGRLDIDQQNVLLFESELGSAWRSGLRSASRLCVAAPIDWRETAAVLFEIERIVRKRLAESFEAKLGRKWPRQALSEDLHQYIRQSSGLEASAGLEYLANPLDFLTLGQLLGLVEQRAEARAAGFDGLLLSELRRLLPIRNRVGHMRLPKDGDLRTCRTARRILRLALKE